jgi:hypothetical protein
MGFFKSASSFTRFFVPEAVTEDFWSYVDDGLEAGRFQELARGQVNARGFSSWDDFFDASFAYASHRKGDYVAFSFRSDECRVPALVLKQHLRRALDDYRRDNEGRWPSRTEKLRLRETVHDALLSRCLPQPRACEVLWHPGEHWLLFGSTSRKMVEGFIEHFEKAFRLYPVPLFHVNWATHQGALDTQQLAHLQALFPSRPQQAFHEGRVLGYEFLTWVWYFTERSDGILTLNDGRRALVALGERLVLSRPDDSRERLTLSAQHRALPEARTALQQGKWVEEAQIFLKVGDNEYTLTLDSSLWALRGVKTPKQLRDFDSEDDDAQFLERMYFLEEISLALNSLYRGFLAGRLQRGYETDVLPAFQEWMQGRRGHTAPL